MRPYYQDELITLYHGDSREILASIVFDVVVTDPPYGIEYKQGMASGKKFGPIVGDESTNLAAWIIEAVHPKPMLVFGSNHFPASLPEPGAWICWDKRCCETADNMIGSPFELAWKNGPDKPGVMYRIQHGGVVNADGYGIKRVHPTQKPIALFEKIIVDHFPSGVVFDPFAGSGTTLVACKQLGRQAVGVEIDAGYCEAASVRLRQGALFA